MDDHSDIIDQLIDDSALYFKSTVELNKLRLTEKLVIFLTSSIFKLTVIFISVIGLIMFSLAVAMFLGQFFNEPYVGFLIVSGVYMAAAMVLNYALQRKIRNMVNRSIIGEIFQS